MTATLVDTGVLLAALNRSDQWHESCVRLLAQVPLPLLTSEAVLTELFHLLGPERSRMEAAWRLIRSVVIVAPIQDSELPTIHELMSQYWDRPMDFADATLVYLARREGISTILTIDRSDFETYRIQGKRKFRVLPESRR